MTCDFKLSTPFVILFSVLLSFGQGSNQKETLRDAYTSYFSTNREVIHLHYNKTSYVVNEPIWFSGYVLDNLDGRPSLNTTNIYVSLFNSEGIEIIRKLCFGQNGKFSGSIDNQKEIPSGTYYLSAYTNFMNNFMENEAFVSEPIQIINPNNSKTNPTQQLTNFDFQLLPEGGHIVNNVKNTVGFKLIDCHGNGLSVQGTVKNSKNETVTSFKSNAFGIGKFDVLLHKHETYTVYYEVNDDVFTKTLPEIQNTGFTISVNNYTNENTTYVSLKTNALTLEKNTNKSYYLVINQNDKTSISAIEIDNLKLENTIPIPNPTLVPGVNTITLFNDQLQPILERLIFKYQPNLFLKSSVYTGQITQDSITINIKTSKQNNTPIPTDVSVSILPKATLSGAISDDIIANLLLKPYINGHIENPNYYFSNIDRSKKYDLDLLLLTQGWSKYNWKNIKQGAANLEHTFNAGITIEGNINVNDNSTNSYSVQMFSLTQNINEFANVKSDNSFSFENFYLKDKIQVNFNVYKNNTIDESLTPLIRQVNNNINYNKPIVLNNKICNDYLSFNSHEKNDYNLLITNTAEKLDTINLNYKKTKKEVTNLIHEKSYIANKFSKGIKIDSMARRNFGSVLDVIEANGFYVQRVTRGLNSGGRRVIIKNRNPVTFIASNEPLLIIDDANVGHDYSILTGMTLNDIDEMFIDPNGNGYGARGGAGVIRIYRKQGTFIAEKNSAATNDLTINNGFTIEKAFYIPQFYDVSETTFESYGAIDWKSNLSSDTKGNINYKITNRGLDELLVIIQGFTSSGELLSEVKTLTINKKQ